MVDMLNIHVALNDFQRAIAHDAVLAKLVHQLRGLIFFKTESIFESVVYAITEQQLSLSAAHSIQNRIILKLGSPIIIGKQQYWPFPTAEQIAQHSKRLLRLCGLSFNKTNYIYDLAKKISLKEINLEELKKIEDTNELIDAMCNIRGIGRWSAEYIAIRGFGRLDVVPADDRGLQKITGITMVGRPTCAHQKFEILHKHGENGKV